MLALLPLAGRASNLVAQADTAYQQERYQQALQLYEQAEREQGTSSDLLYNMGNTCYRMNRLTQAIVCYERALRLDPGNSDARANLQFVRDKAKINEDTGAAFMGNMMRQLVQSRSSNTWAGGAVVTFLLLLAGVALYIFANNVTLRKTGFFGGLTALALTALLLAGAVYMHRYQSSHNEAIVTTPTATLSKAPHSAQGREVAFQLTEGHKVAIQDSVVNTAGGVRETWYRVTTADSRQAWINATDVEKI